MASTTTNYGWTVPTSSDLVKNGATAISTLGQQIDTFLASGIAYAAGVNGTLNSDFSIWQRGTTFTSVSNTGYTADRWCVFTNSITGRDVSRQATNDTTNLPFIKYAARVGRASGNTNTTNLFIGQSFESSNSTRFAGKTVTISYYARAGANFSSASNTLNVYAGWGTGTDQNIFAGFTGQTSLGVSNGTLTTTWQRFTTTGTVGATATQFGLYFGYTPVGTAGAADYFEITGVQLEAGSTATPFQTATGNPQAELAACQRYYSRTSLVAYAPLGIAATHTTTTGRVYSQYPVTMRTAPSFAYGGTIGLGTGGFTSLTGDRYTTTAAMLALVGTSFVAGGANFLFDSGSGTAYFEFSAEL